MDLPIRPRRLRHTPEIRDLVREATLSVNNLVQPLFVIDGNGESEPIASMPGQKRLTISQLVEECRDLHDAGLRGVALFPKLDPKLKNARGMEALNKKTLVLRAASAVKAAVPGLLIFADIALDPYTSHGHDGVLTKDGTDVDNDATVDILTKMAVLHAEAGVDFVAPSDMMDGRIAAVRKALDAAGYEGTGILAYSAKFSSAYYGPFRDAVGSSKAKATTLLNKDTYQLDPANARAAKRELALDEAEGADMLMVKPAGPYLDIIRMARESTTLPVAAYQVSGEYSQIMAAAQLGWLDYKKTRDESLVAIKRAGADFILTYFAGEIARQG
jgi:porphobilinogen synthase